MVSVGSKRVESSKEESEGQAKSMYTLNLFGFEYEEEEKVSNNEEGKKILNDLLQAA